MAVNMMMKERLDTGTNGGEQMKNKAGYTANTSRGWVGGAEMRVFTL